MKVMCYTRGHVDHRTGPDWPDFVTDSQQSGTSSNKIDLILDMRLLVINRPLRPRGDRQARPRGPEEVVERWLRTVEPVKQLRQGEGIHAPGCSIRDSTFTGNRDREWRGLACPNADTARGTSAGARRTSRRARSTVSQADPLRTRSRLTVSASSSVRWSFPCGTETANAGVTVIHPLARRLERPFLASAHI